MKINMRQRLPLTMAVAGMGFCNIGWAEGFIEDSHASLSLRNLYFNTDPRSKNSAPRQEEWGQAFVLNYQSGFTQGPIGFGVDALGMLGVRLDGGSKVGKAGADRTPGVMFPLESDGSAVDDFSSLGVTAKARVSKTELRVGTLQPKLPVVSFSDSRLLPQTYEGQQITSMEIEGLTFTGGQIEHAKGRTSSDFQALAIGGAAKGADTNHFYYAGADYKITKDLLGQYYYGNLEDFYNQHFFGLQHAMSIGEGKLKTDLRYFYNTSDGKNASRQGRAEGYASTGYYTDGATLGEVDNRTWSAMFTYSLGGHAVSAGYQQLSGDSNFPYINQGSLGATGSGLYLITDRMIGSFVKAGERTWLAQYAYDFAAQGIPGLTASVVYLKGDNIASKRGDLSEWERDTSLGYVVQSGVFKNVGLTWRSAVFRSDASSDTDQNRLILSYTLPLF
uniref:OprD family porin n=1 Tax=Pseudomonas sp. MAG733B TaxID=3122079 RepID=UPI00403EBBE8